MKKLKKLFLVVAEDTKKCASMTKEDCEAKGCTNATCEHMADAKCEEECDMSKCATMTKEECSKSVMTMVVQKKTKLNA